MRKVSCRFAGYSRKKTSYFAAEEIESLGADARCSVNRPMGGAVLLPCSKYIYRGPLSRKMVVQPVPRGRVSMIINNYPI